MFRIRRTAPPFIDEVDLDALVRAWAMIGENRDLLLWTLCRIGASDRQKEDYLALLDARGRRRLHIEFGPSGTSSTAAAWYPNDFSFPWEDRPGRIVINTGSEATAYASPWNDNVWRYRSGDRNEQLCFVIRFAAVLVHEMGHSILGVVHLGEGQREMCDLVNRVEGVFFWALAQRYGSPPCIVFSDPSAFLCSANQFPYFVFNDVYARPV